MSGIDWKSIGTSILTLGISYLAKRYAKKRVPKSLEEMLDAAIKTGKVPPALAKTAELMKQAEFNAQLAAVLAASDRLMRSAPAAIAKVERIAPRGKK